MDLGVGAVMLTGALVRRPTAATRAGGGADRGAWRVCRRHAPLVGIGAARLLAVKAADYHEVVSEYGTPAGLDTPSTLLAEGPRPHLPPGHRRAPPQQLGGQPWPRQLAPGRPKDEAFPLCPIRHALELFLHAGAGGGGGGRGDAGLGARHRAVRRGAAAAPPGGALVRPRGLGRARAPPRAPQREQGAAAHDAMRAGPVPGAAACTLPRRSQTCACAGRRGWPRSPATSPSGGWATRLAPPSAPAPRRGAGGAPSRSSAC